MRGVILVGGEGTRLRPLTYARPKQLVPVLNRPLLEHLLRHLASQGVDDLVIAGSASNRAVEHYFGDGAALGVRLRYSYETEPLGSGLAVKQAAAAFRETFVVCNGDIITDLDLMTMVARHRDTGAVLSIALAPVDEPWHYGVAEVDDEERILRFVEKPRPEEARSNLINAGTWIFEPEVLDHVPEGGARDGSLERVTFPALIDQGRRVQGFAWGGYWIDVGSPERYLQANRDLLDEEAAAVAETDVILLAEADAVIDDGAEIGGPVLAGRGVRVRQRARLLGPTVLGEGCEVEDGASVEQSVLWEDVRVGAGAHVHNSILGRGVAIGAGAVIEGAVLADGVRVDEGCILPEGLRAMPGLRLPERGREPHPATASS